MIDVLVLKGTNGFATGDETSDALVRLLVVVSGYLSHRENSAWLLD